MSDGVQYLATDAYYVLALSHYQYCYSVSTATVGAFHKMNVPICEIWKILSNIAYMSAPHTSPRHPANIAIIIMMVRMGWKGVFLTSIFLQPTI